MHGRWYWLAAGCAAGTRGSGCALCTQQVPYAQDVIRHGDYIEHNGSAAGRGVLSKISKLKGAEPSKAFSSMSKRERDRVYIHADHVYVTAALLARAPAAALAKPAGGCLPKETISKLQSITGMPQRPCWLTINTAASCGTRVDQPFLQLHAGGRLHRPCAGHRPSPMPCPAVQCCQTVQHMCTPRLYVKAQLQPLLHHLIRTTRPP